VVDGPELKGGRLDASVLKKENLLDYSEGDRIINISIIGAGYIGLTAAVVFASKGHQVICVDTNKVKVDQINQASSPIREVNLDDLLSTCVNVKKNLRAYSDYNETINSDIVFICVETPSKTNGEIDLTYIRNSAKEIGQALAKVNAYHVVVVKSTVVPGTTEGVIIPILEEYSLRKVGKDFGVAMVPEFLQEGNALHCFLNPDRIIIGEYDYRTGDMLQEIYNDFSSPILRTDIRTAEMIKYAANAFLATKVSFINEIGNMCRKLGIDTYEVAKGIGSDRRIGNKFLDAGIGFGGPCLPKDLEALINRARELDCETELLQSVSNVNKKQPLKLIEIARKRLGNLSNKKITVLGLAFKPNTGDVRQGPSLKIITQLLQEGAIVKVYDPWAMANAKQIFSGGIEFCDNVLDAIAGSDCIIIATEWDEFKDESLYNGKTVIDGRRILNPQKAKQLCLYYEGICW